MPTEFALWFSTLTGLVVPGYIVPLLIISPTSAAVIIIEAIVVFGVMRFSANYLMERFGYSEMFGRDRFFAIILISILVRVCMIPFLANYCRSVEQWDITFDYASQLYSLGSYHHRTNSQCNVEWWL